MNERVWRFVKEHPQSKFGRIKAFLGLDSDGAIGSALADLEERRMVSHQTVFSPELGRNVKSYTAVGHEYVLMPKRGRLVPANGAKAPGPVTVSHAPIPAPKPVAKEPQPVPQSPALPPPPPAPKPAAPSRRSNGVRQVPDSIKGLTLEQAREVYLYLREMFG